MWIAVEQREQDVTPGERCDEIMRLIDATLADVGEGLDTHTGSAPQKAALVAAGAGHPREATVMGWFEA